MTQYAEVSNGITQRLVSRPVWRDEDGEPVSDEVLRAGGYETDENGNVVAENGERVLATGKPGYLPVVDDLPEYDTTTQWIERRPIEEWAIEADVVRATYTVHDRDPAEVTEMLTRAIDAERDRRIEAGFTFNGKLFQARAQDQKRISGAGTLALGAMVAGSQPGNLRWHGGNSDFQWIAADNSTMTMDAQTVFSFGQAAANWESIHVFAARAIKDAAEIPADFTDDSYWP